MKLSEAIDKQTNGLSHLSRPVPTNAGAHHYAAYQNGLSLSLVAKLMFMSQHQMSPGPKSHSLSQRRKK